MCIHSLVFRVDMFLFLFSYISRSGISELWRRYMFHIIKNNACFPKCLSSCLFSLPSITINQLMLYARRNKENEQGGLVSVASLSIARLLKTPLGPRMPLSGSSSGARCAWWQPWAGLSPDWWERDVAPHRGAQQAEQVAERGPLLSGALFCLRALGS